MSRAVGREATAIPQRPHADGASVPIRDVRVSAYRVPTQGGPESDGTLVWETTTLVLVEIDAGGETGMGYTYADRATAVLVRDAFSPALMGADVGRHAHLINVLAARARNLGREGIVSMALSAVDIALWDLRAKLLHCSAAALFGCARERVPIYGSGGFTSYDVRTLCEQLEGWVRSGIPRVKMKVGRDPDADPSRVSAARKAIGDAAQLFVDANGAYARKQAVEIAAHFAVADVSWFEEPVYYQDYEGLAMIRKELPACMELAVGEYGYGPYDFARILDARATDVLQADATRCGGLSGLLAVDGLCQTKLMPLSTHCAPYVQLHAAAAAKMLRHMEYFFDHVRIERWFFDGTAEPVGGALRIDMERPGIGLEFKRADAAPFAL